MKKILLIAVIASLPLAAQAIDVNVNLGNLRVDAPGVSLTFGSRNDRGYYWDGQDWRDADYWRKHNGPRGERYYTGRGRGRGHDRHHDDHDRRHCPPGHAKKGEC